jgi:hypothetical protein
MPSAFATLFKYLIFHVSATVTLLLTRVKVAVVSMLTTEKKEKKQK